MELSEQLRRQSLVLAVSWRSRDENMEADALTNQCFDAFRSEHRVHVNWEEIGFSFSPRLTEQAERFFTAVTVLKRERRDPTSNLNCQERKRGRLAQDGLEPW